MNNNRKQEARRIRIAAAELAADRIHPAHVTNGDEQKFRTIVNGKNSPSYLASFTKGLPHNIDSGLICNPEDFQQFVKAIDSADPRDFIDTPLGPKTGKWESEKIKNLEKVGTKIKVRAWESQGGGQTYNLEGPDSQAVTMPPAPAIGSKELTAEMGEVYGQALLRDVPFTEIAKYSCNEKNTGSSKFPIVKDVLDKINDLDWFKSNISCSLDANEKSRKRGKFTGQNAFRGITAGDNIGPYISQFLLSGNRGVNGNDTINKHAKGLIAYGSIRINQRVRFATPNEDYMTQWKEWFDVQNGANVGGQESYMAKGKGVSGYRFITTPRDLSTYVHYDALYEAYLNACLLLLGENTPFDPDIPFQRDDSMDHQQGFAHFGGPHILTLVTEVATRALKAVRYQKFNVHRRFRPEVLAARLTKHDNDSINSSCISQMVTDLQPILDMIAKKNPEDTSLPNGNYLLPMAFCEGSPMHPSYGAGHSVVAGACVTILKAFFDHKHPLTMAGNGKAFVPDSKGYTLKAVNVVDPKNKDKRVNLTVEGELNKLASNVSIGRDWAGVHFYSDYIESLRMGEQIAIGILEEEKLTFGENFSMTVPLFDGGSVRI